MGLPLNDKWRRAMMRPDCIMGVTADNGGSWLSPIREDGAQPTTLPATAGQPWAIGSGMLTPFGGMVIDNGFEFPGGDENVVCGTALDFRGYKGSFTFVCDFEVDREPDEITHMWFVSLMGQGYPPAGSATCTPASMYFRKKTDAKRWEFFAYINDGTASPGISANMDGAFTFGVRHTGAFVRDAAALKMYLYFDGEKVAESNPKDPTPIGNDLVSDVPASYYPERGVCVGAGRVGANTRYESDYRVFNAAVFNRALSAEEIADFS